MNAAMARRLLVVAAALAVALSCAPAAGAKTLELGSTDAAPTCPATPCLAVSRTTGYQIKIGDQRGLFTVPQDGKIVAWSIRPLDGLPGAKWERVASRVVGDLHPGAIVLLHDATEDEKHEPAAVKALPTILDAMKERGFEGVRVDSWLPDEATG